MAATAGGFGSFGFSFGNYSAAGAERKGRETLKLTDGGRQAAGEIFLSFLRKGA